MPGTQGWPVVLFQERGRSLSRDVRLDNSGVLDERASSARLPLQPEIMRWPFLSRSFEYPCKIEYLAHKRNRDCWRPGDCIGPELGDSGKELNSGRGLGPMVCLALNNPRIVI